MGILDFLAQILGKPDQLERNDTRPSDELMQAVDLVVKKSHPNIHYVTNYRKKLIPAVEHTLGYADELISMFSPAVKIDKDSWGKDFRINPLFLNEKQFLKFFSENERLNEFFKKTGASSCFALLVMDKTVRNIFGTELEGEILKRDVIKKSVNFSKHIIQAPSRSEEEARDELSMRILSLLATRSLDEILSLIKWKQDLENERKMLDIQIQMRSTSVQKTMELLPDPDASEEIKEAQGILKQLDERIAEARTGTDEPEDYLNGVTELLNHPEKYLKAEYVKMLLNDMNIIVDSTYRDRISELELLEFSTPEGLRKATMLIEVERMSSSN